MVDVLKGLLGIAVGAGALGVSLHFFRNPEDVNRIWRFDQSREYIHVTQALCAGISALFLIACIALTVEAIFD
jgi:hypothetical protein